VPLSQANRKNIPPVVKNKKLKKGVHCGQLSDDVTVLSWQDEKQVAIFA
jgi:hypothetical protein